MSENVQVSSSEGVCELRLNRPEKRNALTLAMYDALTDSIAQAEADESVRVLLLTGAGAGFTAGNDIKDFLAGPTLEGEQGAVRFLRRLPAIRKLLVAAVHGSTVGIGVTLLLHCDLVVAARNTRFSLPFVQLGLVPEAASSLLLPRLLGHQRAMELLLLGTPFDAETAERFGLVNRVVDDGRLLEEGRALARSLAALPAGAMRATKQLLRSESGVRARIEEELLAFQGRLESPEFRQAARAFLDKSR